MPLVEMFLSEKFKRAVKIDDFLFINPDKLLLCDALGAHVLQRLKELGGNPGFPSLNVFATCGKNSLPRDVDTANFFEAYQELVHEYDFNFLGPQQNGVLHYVFPENIPLRPGEIILGTDSHTLTAGAFGVLAFGIGVEEMAAVLKFGKTWFKIPPTVKVCLKGKMNWPVSVRDVMSSLMKQVGPERLVGTILEFWDQSEPGLNAHERMTLTSISAELGVVSSIFATEDVFEDQLEMALDHRYQSVLNVDMGTINEPMVAWPHNPFNLHKLSDSKGIKINRCFIGSCSGGGLTGLREAANVLKGKRIHKDINMVIIPQSPGVYMGALKEGLLEVFLESGAIVSFPACGPCMANHSGVLAKNDVCLSTGNRNFKGRMGDPGSSIYLVSAAVAAFSAIHGELREFT